MRITLIITFMILSLNNKAQDPSMSQFDLNTSYTNPSFTGIEGTIKILTHSRSQWNYLNENFKSSFFEISSQWKLNPNIGGTDQDLGYGIGIINEKIGIISGENNVFINKIEIYPSASYLIKLEKNINAGIGFSMKYKKYSLDPDFLIFSDQWGEFGSFDEISEVNINSDINEIQNIDLGAGLLFIRRGRQLRYRSNRIILGHSLHNIRPNFENFLGVENNDAKFPFKHISHAELYYSVPDYDERNTFVPRMKLVFKHERYIKKPLAYLQKTLFSKTEIGSTAFINNTNIEFGVLYRRVNHVERTDMMNNMQSFIPLLRYRFRIDNYLLNISYSMDINSSTKEDNLNFKNTLLTHEVGVSIDIFKGGSKNPSCPAYGTMKENPLYQDIMNNGLLNKRKPKRNFN
tara:strand:- start:4590 stop:5801 length:1212 start_codon:yes stop_codon:yes gene_type:complete